MGFRTKIDTSNNRQIKQFEKTITNYSGATVFGLPYSAMTSGPNLLNTGVTEDYYNVVGTFSGNNTETVFVWYDHRMSLGEQYIPPLTPSNSGDTFYIPPTFQATATINIDGDYIATAYSGVSFDVGVMSMFEDGGVYSGTVESTEFLVYSASSLDYPLRRLWVDVLGFARFESVLITSGATLGSVWTCTNVNGEGAWLPSSGGSFSGVGFDTYVTGGTYNDITNTILFTNNTGGTFTVTGITSGNNTITGETNGVLYFNEFNSPVTDSFFTRNFNTGFTFHQTGETVSEISFKLSDYTLVVLKDPMSPEFESGYAIIDDTTSESGYTVGVKVGVVGSSPELRILSVNGGDFFNFTESGSITQEGTGATGILLYVLPPNFNPINIGDLFSVFGGGDVTVGFLFGSFCVVTDIIGDTIYGSVLTTNYYDMPSALFVSFGGPPLGIYDLNLLSTIENNTVTKIKPNGFVINSKNDLFDYFEHKKGADGSYFFNSFEDGDLNLGMVINKIIPGGFFITDERVSDVQLDIILNTESYGNIRINSSNYDDNRISSLDISPYESYINSQSGDKISVVITNPNRFQIYHSNAEDIGNTILSIIEGSTDGLDIVYEHQNESPSYVKLISGGTVAISSLKVDNIGGGPGTIDLGVDAEGFLVDQASDISLKENISTISDALDKVLQLRGVKYNWKNRLKGGDYPKLGFIAQEVGEVIPELVYKTTSNDYLGVHYKDITPLLVEAIKELTNKYDNLINNNIQVETVLSEDNYITLNYNGTKESSNNGGIIINKGIDKSTNAKFTIDSSGDWVTNNNIKPKGFVLPEGGVSSLENSPNNSVVCDGNYLYIKLNDGVYKNIPLNDL